MTEPVNVLVVEDSADQANLLRRYFERAGCSVTTVATAEEAIVSYLSVTPDLAVVDLVLPGMDGWQLISKLQNDRPHCPIVVTSVRDAADFPATQANLPKPFTGEQVRQVLRDTIPRWHE